jgi:hypothetical protein
MDEIEENPTFSKISQGGGWSPPHRTRLPLFAFFSSCIAHAVQNRRQKKMLFEGICFFHFNISGLSIFQYDMYPIWLNNEHCYFNPAVWIE